MKTSYFETKFINHFFHILDDLLKNYYKDLAIRAQRNNSLDGVFKGVFPIIRLIVTLVVFIAFFFIPDPHSYDPSIRVEKPDTTVWVGSLSFFGAIGIGLIAGAPWFAQFMFKIIPAFLLDSIKLGIIGLNPEITEYKSPERYIRDEIRKNPLAVHSFSARIVLNGIVILAVSAATMPLEIWLPSNVQRGILMSGMFWVFSYIFSLTFIPLLSFNETALKMYRLLKEQHDQQMMFCERCNRDISKNNGPSDEITSHV